MTIPGKTDHGRLRSRWRRIVEAQSLRMAHVDALPQLSLMGVVAGLLSGGVIIAFRWIVEIGSPLLSSMQHSDAFENIEPHWRLAIAVTGGLIVGLLFHLTHRDMRQVGVVHVIERLNYHQGHMPLRNALMQFVGAALSIVCGHSVGREGPSIHLGATSGSLLGRKLGLPNNSVRTLVGCGVVTGSGAAAGAIRHAEIARSRANHVCEFCVIMAPWTSRATSWSRAGCARSTPCPRRTADRCGRGCGTKRSRGAT